MTNFIQDNWEILLGIGGALTGCYQWTINKGRTQESNSNEIKRINTTTKRLETDLQGVKDDLQGVKDDLQGVKDDLQGVKNDIISIKAVLISNFPNAEKIFSMKHSPLRLNEIGERVFNEINGAKFLEENKDFFLSQIEQKAPKTALDVEQTAKLTCTINTDNDIFNDIKNYVYNAPSLQLTNEEGKKQTYNISMYDICFILSLPLRDMYLEAHPELQ